MVNASIASVYSPTCTRMNDGTSSMGACVSGSLALATPSGGNYVQSTSYFNNSIWAQAGSCSSGGGSLALQLQQTYQQAPNACVLVNDAEST